MLGPVEPLRGLPLLTTREGGGDGSVGVEVSGLVAGVRDALRPLEHGDYLVAVEPDPGPVRWALALLFTQLVLKA